jgi:hypothetical protein
MVSDQDLKTLAEKVLDCAVQQNYPYADRCIFCNEIRIDFDTVQHRKNCVTVTAKELIAQN